MLRPAASLDHAWIAAHIPHRGSMCLLDAVLQWDERQLTCRARSHRDPANPLRQFGRLGAACGIEYAAQAMAVHGALMAGENAAPRPGMLVSVRGVSLYRTRLDDVAADLRVRAERLSGDAGMLMYAFAIEADGAPLLEGRASVLLASPDPMP